MDERHKPPLPTCTRATSRTLRQASTEAEKVLLHHLRANRLKGYKFRRQYTVPPYVADFYCDERRLAVELDGSQHNIENDKVRTQYLQSQQITVLRFWNNEVLAQRDAVLEVILAFLDNRTLTPTPLPMGSG